MLKVIWLYTMMIIFTGERYLEVTDGLKILDVTKADDGEYTCRAEVEVDGRYDERRIAVAVHSEYIQ